MKYVYNLDKVKGCIVGGAIGDALGYPVEFMRSPDIHNRFGPKGVTRLLLSQNGIAEFSDDTQMTLFTATGLLAAETWLNSEGGMDDSFWKESVKNHLIDWFCTQNMTRVEQHYSWLYDVPELQSQRAPGATCLGALKNLVDGVVRVNNSKGCGGIMRTAPVALCRGLRENKTPGFMYKLAGELSDLTHDHPLGFIPSAMLVMIMNKITHFTAEIDRLALEKIVLSSVLEIGKVEYDNGFSVVTYDKFFGDLGELCCLVLKAVDFAAEDKPDEECITKLGTGPTGETALAIALYCALRHTDSFEDAVIAAVNHGGDSDSTGAVCGNLMGLIHGYDAIPQYFKDDLELLPVLEEVAEDLYTGSAYAEDEQRWKSKYLKGDWELLQKECELNRNRKRSIVTAKHLEYVEEIPFGTCPHCGAKLLVTVYDREGSTRILESPSVINHLVAYGGIKGKGPDVRRVCSGCFIGYVKKVSDLDEFGQCRYLGIIDRSDKHWHDGMIEGTWMQMAREKDPWKGCLLFIVISHQGIMFTKIILFRKE